VRGPVAPRRLRNDADSLEQRIARAAQARDAPAGTAAVPGPAAAATSVQAPPPEVQAQYTQAVRSGDLAAERGNHFDAVLAYERAARIAYDNRRIDASGLEERLARSRKARDEGEPGEVMRFLGLTAAQAGAVRERSPAEICASTGICFDNLTEADRWRIVNPYLPGSHRFFDFIHGATCSADGTAYVAADGIVPAEATRRRPRSNGDWYADNGHGVWRVAPDGQVTPFAVGPYGFYPPDKLKPAPKAYCNARVEEVLPFGPRRWGGIALAPNGDVYVSDKEYHTILRLRRDGVVEHVAGGGERVCTYDRFKDRRQSGWRDGPGSQALFSTPMGLAVDRNGNLLVADPGNCALRRIDPSGEVSTVQRGCFTEPGDKGNMRRRVVHEHVTLDPQGRAVVGGTYTIPSVNAYTNIHRILEDGRTEQLLSATLGYASSGELRASDLGGLAYLPDGRLLMADGYNDLLRTVDGKTLTDWLGARTRTDPPDVDGRPPNARLRRPGSLCMSANGTLFVTPGSLRSGSVRRVDVKTREVSTWVY
jgi:sugar lactone lactonase YvrE